MISDNTRIQNRCEFKYLLSIQHEEQKFYQQNTFEMKKLENIQFNYRPTLVRKDSIETPLASMTQKKSWKQVLRQQKLTQPVLTKPIHKLAESAKSKNIPKNIAKVIISMILNTKLCDQQIQNKKQFVTFIKKNKNIQNLETLLRLSRPHKNPEIDVHHKTFRKICYYFLKTQFIQYVFNSKIKDPQWHICYRNDLINIFRKLN